MSEENKFIYVDDWKPQNEDEVFLIPDNKLVIIPFERIFEHDFGSKTISSFIISRTIYSNKLHKICKYSNYFINFYDKDKELLLSYLKIKTIIDDKSKNIKPKKSTVTNNKSGINKIKKTSAKKSKTQSKSGVNKIKKIKKK